MATSASDTLEPFGIGVGALLVLVGIGTLFGTPWAYKPGGLLLAAGQVLGALVAIGIGVGLALIAKE